MDACLDVGFIAVSCPPVSRSDSLLSAKSINTISWLLTHLALCLEASRYAKNLKGHVLSDEYVLILCGVDPGQSKDMATAGDPGECDTVCS